jgi:Mg/Co/Ni transporter MgtE
MYYGYVLNPKQQLLGVVSLRQLFAADPGKLVQEIMASKDLVSSCLRPTRKKSRRLSETAVC